MHCWYCMYIFSAWNFIHIYTKFSLAGCQIGLFYTVFQTQIFAVDGDMYFWHSECCAVHVQVYFQSWNSPRFALNSRIPAFKKCKFQILKKTYWGSTFSLTCIHVSIFCIKYSCIMEAESAIQMRNLSELPSWSLFPLCMIILC